MLSVPTDDRYLRLELNPQRRKERTFGALLRRLDGMTRSHPVLMLFEDAQWADPSSLELLDMLIDRLAQLPVLLVDILPVRIHRPLARPRGRQPDRAEPAEPQAFRDAGRTGDRRTRRCRVSFWNGSSRRPMVCRCSSRN